MSGEIFGAEKTFFFGGHEKEKDGALNFLGMRFEAGSSIQHQGAAGTVVHRAVINAVAVDGSADADVVDVRRKDDEFIFESGIGGGKFGDNVCRFERLSKNDGVGFERNGQGKMRKGLAVFSESRDFSKGMARAGEELLC